MAARSASTSRICWSARWRTRATSCHARARARCALHTAPNTPPPRLTCVGGAQNATKRYDAYREVARKLKYFDREPLPLCVVATIRSIFPSQHGTYVGYRGPH